MLCDSTKRRDQKRKLNAVRKAKKCGCYDAIVQSLAYKSEVITFRKQKIGQKQGQPHKKAKVALEDTKSAKTAFRALRPKCGQHSTKTRVSA